MYQKDSGKRTLSWFWFIKSTLGIDSILKSISCLLVNSSQNENTMEQSFSHNQPNAIISRPSEFVSVNQNDDNTVTLNDFDFIYLDSVNFPNS